MGEPDFLTIVLSVMRSVTEKSGSTHPHDVMCQVLTVAETLYEFTAELPYGAAKALYLKEKDDV